MERSKLLLFAMLLVGAAGMHRGGREISPTSPPMVKGLTQTYYDKASAGTCPAPDMGSSGSWSNDEWGHWKRAARSLRYRATRHGATRCSFTRRVAQPLLADGCDPTRTDAMLHAPGCAITPSRRMRSDASAEPRGNSY